MEVQQAVLKLLAKVESMETNIETKLEAVKDKIGNIEEKMTNRIEDIDKKLESHCNDDNDIDSILDSHDRSLEKAKGYIERIHILEGKYIILEQRVDKIQKIPIETKAKFIDDFVITFKNIIFTGLATGIVGFIGYLLITWIKG